MSLDRLPRQITDQIDALGGIQSVDNHRMSEEELSQIEASLGTEFPSSLRVLLSDYGSFGFAKVVRFIPVTNHSRICDFGINAFFGPKKSEFYGLVNMLQIYRNRNRLPATMIPIANNVFGDLICLGIHGEEKDKVFFWDHENEPDIELYWAEHGHKPLPREYMFQNVYLIARDFDDFMSRLRIWEEPDQLPPGQGGT